MKKLYFVLLLLSSGLVFAQPDINAPAPLSACDYNNDGTEIFDLTATIPEIMGALPASDYVVQFFNSQSDADTNNYPITTPSAFSGANGQLVYVRVHEVADPASYATVALQLYVNAVATATVTASSENVCVGDSAYFTLTGVGGSLPYTFEYSLDGLAMPSVSTGTSSVIIDIPTNVATSYTLQIHTIYSGAGNCANNVSVSATINIVAPAVANLAPDIVHTENPNDGLSTFDLTENAATVLGGQTGVTLWYYLSEFDAMASVNALPSPQAFDNTTNPQTIWVRAQNDVTGCFSVTHFNVVVTDPGIVYIPDAAFKAKLIADGVDTNTDGEIQFAEAEAVTMISIDDLGVADLTGILSFVNLQELYASGNQITSANLSGLAFVTKAYLNDNSITSFNVNGMTALVDFQVGNNMLTSATVSGLPNLEIFYASYNGNLTTVNLSGLPALKTLTVGESNLGYLDASNLPALESLYCAYNDLSGLNVSGLTALKVLDFSSNNIQNIDVGGLSALEALYFNSNPVQSISWNGLSSIKWVHCNNTGMNTFDLPASATLLDIECAFNNLTVLDVTQYPSLTNLKCANNQLFALDTAALPNLLYLECQNNQIQVTLDLNNCTQLEFVSAFANQIEMLFVKNGVDENIDSATFGQNPLVYICADDFQVAALQSLAGPGVQVNSYCSFTPGGLYNTITGNVKFDTGNDGCGALDMAQPLIKLSVTNGTETSFVFTNESAQYSVYVGDGNYTVTPEFENDFYNVSPAAAAVSFPVVDGSVSTNDFCLTANGVHHDVEVAIMPVVPARPGFDAVYKIVLRNKGNQVNNGMVVFTYNEAVLDWVSSNPMQNNQSAGSLTFFYYDLLPFENRAITVALHVNAPTDTPAVNIGDILAFTADASNLNGTDEMPLDNTTAFEQAVVGSFDPNDKKCLEGEIASPALIGDYLHYVIQFENTGTAPAENIVIKDVIDTSKFDVSTLQIMHSSHNVVCKGTGDGTIFIFQNINLDSGGHGNILLKVKTLGTLSEGDAVTNKADIYFDYNFPIETNDANTTFQSLAVNDPGADNSIALYPNPVRNVFTAKAATSITSIQLYDVQGRLLQAILANDSEVKVDLSTKQSGVYFARIATEKGAKVEKLIKQ